jgi:hypothetical protein
MIKVTFHHIKCLIWIKPGKLLKLNPGRFVIYLWISTVKHYLSIEWCFSSAVQCSAVQCSAVQYSAVQCSAVHVCRKKYYSIDYFPLELNRGKTCSWFTTRNTFSPVRIDVTKTIISSEYFRSLAKPPNSIWALLKTGDSMLCWFSYRAFCPIFRNNQQMHQFLSVYYFT